VIYRGSTPETPRKSPQFSSNCATTAGFGVDRVESDEFATICHFNRELAEA